MVHTLAALVSEEPCTELICAPADPKDLFILPPIFEIGPLEITRPILLMLLAAAIVIVAVLVGFRDPSRIVPSRFGLVMESAFTFVRRDIARDIIGPGGEKFAPFLATLFLWILVMNFFEITPLINFPPTSRMSFPLLMSLTVWVIFIVVGIVKQGPLSYFKNSVVPSGVPKALLILVIPIEIVSTFLVRPVSLAVRLFANLVAGHILLTVFALTTYAWIDAGAGQWKLYAAFVPFAFQVVFTGFELLVAFLQAYIFTLLTAVYIGSSMHAEH